MASSFPTPGQYRSEKNGSCFESCLHTNMDPRILSQAPIHAGLHTQGVIDSRRSGLPLRQSDSAAVTMWSFRKPPSSAVPGRGLP